MFARVFSRILNKKSNATLCCYHVKLTSSLTNCCRNLCTIQDNLNSEQMLSERQIQEISDGDLEIEKKVRLLLMEYSLFKYDNAKVPSLVAIRKEHWLDLCLKRSQSDRLEYYSNLFKIENRYMKYKQNKEKRRVEEVAKRVMDRVTYTNECGESGNDMSNLSKNKMFINTYNEAINKLSNYKLIQAMTFGQKIIFDCSFDDEMSKMNGVNCAKQLMIAFVENRSHVDPFDIHFCNVNFDTLVMKELNKLIVQMREPWFPLQFHTESYLDLFPKKHLVYLTGDCHNHLKKFNYNDVYIIGSIVDKFQDKPLSVAKAKSEGLRMAKLPLTEYLHLGIEPSKNLTLEQMIRIMLDMKHTNDWNYALRHVPKRKIFTDQNEYTHYDHSINN